MDAQRLQGLAFLLSAAALAMPGCDPEVEPDDQGPATGSTSAGSTSSTGDASGGSAASESDSASGNATMCERRGAVYVECYPGYATVAEASAWCIEHIAYLGDISQECADTYVAWADCLSYLDCSEVQTSCLEELRAHAILLCLGHE